MPPSALRGALLLGVVLRHAGPLLVGGPGAREPALGESGLECRALELAARVVARGGRRAGALGPAGADRLRAVELGGGDDDRTAGRRERDGLPERLRGVAVD